MLLYLQMRRALREAKRADIIILVVDLSDNTELRVHAGDIDKKELISQGILATEVLFQAFRKITTYKSMSSLTRIQK